MCTLSIEAINGSAYIFAIAVYVNVLSKLYYRWHKDIPLAWLPAHILTSPPSTYLHDCCLYICLLWVSFFILLRGLFSICIISLGEQYSIEIIKP